MGEHRDDGVDVGAFPGVDEMGNELTQSPIAECLQGRLLASCRESRVDGLVCALEGGVDRGGCHLERRRRLLGREPEHVSQDQHGALLCGDLLQGGDECELDAFALLVTGGGGGEFVLQFEPAVRVGLDPDGLDEWLRAWPVRVGCGAVVDRQHALGAALDRLQACVRCDREEPGLE